jgi:hypothetical protein
MVNLLIYEFIIITMCVSSYWTTSTVSVPAII